MLAATTLTWTLLLSSISSASNLTQSMTNIQGFGSQEACLAARLLILESYPKEARQPFALCVPVDASKPLPNVLQGLLPLVD